MKKIFALALAAALSLGAFAVGCGGPANSGNTNGQGSGGTDVENQGNANGEENKQPEDRKLRALPEDFKYEVTTEQYPVKYGDVEIFGQIREPDAKGKFPLVILSHGFNGHYTDFPTECTRLAERGYVAYAFDFCGAQNGGKSKGRTEDEYTPLTMKQDLIAIINELKTLYEVDETQIFLFGGSQGGFVTALAAADDAVKELVSAVALYFPAFNIPDDWHGKPEVKTEFMGYFIGAEFIKSVQDLDPYAEIGKFKKDVCIVWGDQDALVKREYIDKAAETYGKDRTELTVIPGAGHGFGGAALTTAVDTVLAFLEARTYES